MSKFTSAQNAQIQSWINENRDVESFAEIVGIMKLVNARTVKIMRIAKQTQMSSLNVPLEKITRRPDSVRTRNC